MTNILKKTILMTVLFIGVSLSSQLLIVKTVNAEDDILSPTSTSTATSSSSSSSDPYEICDEISTSQFCKNKDMSLMNIVKTGANVLLFLIGSIAVIMIIYSGFLYLTSMGDASNVKRAKDTLVYAIIGLVVAILAGAIVNFVLSNFITTKKPTTTTYRSPTSLMASIELLGVSSTSSLSANTHSELNS